MTGRVWQHIQGLLRDGPIHMTLLDPASSPGKQGEEIALIAAEKGTHAIMVGGSTDVSSDNLDTLVSHIKERTQLPVIYFPSTAGAMSPQVDAIYFLSALNSRDPRFIVGEQSVGAPLIKAIGMEAIAMGYILVDPGMKVGLVSDADVIPRTKDGAERAAALALTAQYFGMRLVYLECGSGAPQPCPVDIVRAVREAIDIPLVVGGGIRTAAQARGILEAGADILVTGTIAENRQYQPLGEIVAEVRARRRA
ncbi:MAG TPA: geranylgeranylglyceryl/heptaprenylglyceryl phosphate synthase [Candidatus Thermoplasmatota archaeon]|nr:geranylgeranylglyceryl/heptaprenylglyceryl phosphate synthase [Candidatus Thermoplasmatota archaeon]